MEDGVDDDLLAVVAHSLLGPVIGAHEVALTLIRRGEDMPDDIRRELLDLVVQRCRFVSDLLTDMIRGGSPAVLDALEGLRPASQQDATP